ncbi:hypothetical protein C8J25_1032 [Sphingomonas faeni]|uniref:Uncharacterized protein n=1 Tax=Sphingomonas faeni TaxID=185950 RepID=A0A2T5U715_9SPHN|nr:hypothetical protein [Sphingomonas faeni]PTW47287.1 hypothetical protein C8J25_1032 [Sphingomonas faeni]
MAIRFGSVAFPMFDIVTHDLHGLPTRTAGEFGALPRAIGTSGTGVAKPKPLDLSLASLPSPRPS